MELNVVLIVKTVHSYKWKALNCKLLW